MFIQQLERKKALPIGSHFTEKLHYYIANNGGPIIL